MKNKVILITGANKGIGLEIARQSGKLGFYVVISGRDEKKLASALALLKKDKIEAEYLVMDVSSVESIKNAVWIFARMDMKLDVLVNNAGVSLRGDNSLLTNNAGIIEETITTNSLGPLNVTREFLGFMKTPGRIIMISSMGGSMTQPIGGWSPAYCTSKSFLNAITRHLAFELKGRNISVNAVNPGWVRTDMGGSSAPLSVGKGAETPVWLAAAAPQDLTGKFFSDNEEIPW